MIISAHTRDYSRPHPQRGAAAPFQDATLIPTHRQEVIAANKIYLGISGDLSITLPTREKSYSLLDIVKEVIKQQGQWVKNGYEGLCDRGVPMAFSLTADHKPVKRLNVASNGDILADGTAASCITLIHLGVEDAMLRFLQDPTSEDFRPENLGEHNVELYDNLNYWMMQFKMNRSTPISYASHRLRDHEDFWLAATKQKDVRPSDQSLMSTRLKSSQEFNLKLINSLGQLDFLEHCSDSLKSDIHFLKSAAIRLGPEVINYASPEIKANPESIVSIIRSHGNLSRFQHYSSCRLYYPEVTLRYLFLRELKQEQEAEGSTSGVHLSLKNEEDRGDLRILFRDFCDLAPLASEAAWDQPELVRLAISRDGSLLKYASARLKSDPEIVKLACNSGLKNIKYTGFNMILNPRLPGSILADRLGCIRRRHPHAK